MSNCVALVVAVSDEHFRDDDDICLLAGNYVCGRLEPHLIQHGHTIPEWIRGGCDEDWGVYFESESDGKKYDYRISYFPPTDDGIEQMLIQFGLKRTFFQNLFNKSTQIESGHEIQDTISSFGRLFDRSRMLTQAELDAEI